jgi:gamma-glutamylcysteine synthetase
MADTESSDVALLADLRYLDGHPWQVRPASASTIWLALIRNAINVHRYPEFAAAALTAAARSAECISGIRGQATEAATQLLELLAQH